MTTEGRGRVMRRPTVSTRSPLEIRELRQRYVEGWTQSRLANKYHMSIGNVGRIVRGDIWQTAESGWSPLDKIDDRYLTDKLEE